jgi:hypothetical protein
VMRDTVPPGSDSISGSFYESDSQFHSLFRDGKALSQGDIYTRPEYARTLQILAERGAEAFYEGEIAEAVVEVVRARGGLMKAEDLRGAQVWKRDGALIRQIIGLDGSSRFVAASEGMICGLCQPLPPAPSGCWE